MSETEKGGEVFQHCFGGWHDAPARRWTNADGSPGGIVAASAAVDPDVIVPAESVVWPNAKITNGASIGYGASIGADDWLFVAGPQGSRNAWATVTWSAKGGLRWWIGCQHGITTDALRDRIQSDHGESEHGDDYRHLVDMVERHPGLARAQAAAARTGDAA